MFFEAFERKNMQIFVPFHRKCNVTKLHKLLIIRKLDESQMQFTVSVSESQLVKLSFPLSLSYIYISDY